MRSPIVVEERDVFTIELDIFSGRPNPTWTLSPKEAGEFAERLRTGSVKVRPVDDVRGVLGYRGIIVRAGGAEASQAAAAGMPTAFRLCDDTAVGPQVEARLALLSTPAAERAVVGPALEAAQAAVVGQSDRAPADCTCSAATTTRTTSTSLTAVAAATTCWYYYTGSTTSALSFWNDTSSHIYDNNCYNYASNWRTNTFAQPGRGSGSMFTSVTASNVMAAAARDGWQYNCSAGCLLAKLVIWPGADYHWYRYTSDTGSALWTHKPGHTPARNTDDSGHSIFAVESANRGNYTVLAGPMFSPGTARTTVR